jgi:hypothetical protein
MRQDGYLESGTLGMLTRRPGRPWALHGAETWVWLGSWRCLSRGWLFKAVAGDGPAAGS